MNKCKDCEPFCVVRSDSAIHIIDSWYLAFGKNVSPTLFKNADVAEMWCDWLNELWAQEPLLHGTCEVLLCEIEKRKCKTCSSWVFKRYVGFHEMGKCKEFGHGFTKEYACCKDWNSKK